MTPEMRPSAAEPSPTGAEPSPSAAEPSPTGSEPRSPLARRLLREPVVHFAALALALFALAGLGDALRPETVDVDPLEIEGRIRQLERGRGAALTDAERALAERAYVDEQILAREARARGLDDDPRIRSILSQKMLQVLSMGLEHPSEAELRAYYADNEARYARPPSVTVEQLLRAREPDGAPPPPGEPDGSPPPPGEAGAAGAPGEAEAGGAPEEARAGGPPERTLLRGVTLAELSLSFGAATAERVFGAERGAWVGPHRTDRGELWFRIVERLEAGPPPPLETVLGQVRFDWMSEREEAYLQGRIAELRRRYRIRLVGREGER